MNTLTAFLIVLQSFNSALLYRRIATIQVTEVKGAGFLLPTLDAIGCFFYFTTEFSSSSMRSSSSSRSSGGTRIS